MRRLVLPALAILTLNASPAAAQQPDTAGGWDHPRALDLLERARARRLLPAQDTSLRNYTAHAEGFVYFYLDRRDGSERTLVKTDQVALDLYWAQPDMTKQRIVGLRDESRLPNRMYYHLDHLTVVQNGFGDIIRMGDGDEVSDVPHPAARGSDAIYMFRLTDSMTIDLPGAPEPIRVYEVQVRPRRTDRSAIVGSIFIERATADVVRMRFTFTPVSYVDRRLDHISVSLDNGLWEGRYWLPYEQSLLIRRQLPELDFAAGAVIQGRMRIREYTFNDSVPRSTFLGTPVSTAPPEVRDQHEFESGLYDDLNDAGLGTDLLDVRATAAELLGARLSGLPAWRLSLGSASSALRYNRAEGVAAGAGVAWVPSPRWRAALHGGYAFGAEHVWGSLEMRRNTETGSGATLQLLLNDARDLGVRPAVPPLINTITAAFAGDDYQDLHFATGARLRLRHPLGGRLAGEAELVAERHLSASLAETDALFSNSSQFRPVLPIDEGDLGAVIVGLRRSEIDPRARDWSGSVHLELGTFDEGAWLRPVLSAALRRASADHRNQFHAQATAGTVTPNAPAQRLFLLGGMNTLPGYDHRAFVGRHHAVVNVEASTALVEPWVRLRAIVAAGAVGGLPEPPPQPAGNRAWQSWGRSGSDGIRTSAGAGVSLFWDLLRIDAVRGLNGGRWQFIVGFHREFWDIS
jgi:hypothetical protein